MRARGLKPGFFKNEALASHNPLARILFAGLWCMADREGRLEDRPDRIKVEVLPYDRVNVDRLLNELAAAPEPFIVRYTVSGRGFIQIINFSKHQYPHIKEPKSTIPEPSRAPDPPGGPHHSKLVPRPADSITDSITDSGLYGQKDKNGASTGPDTRPEPTRTDFWSQVKERLQEELDPKEFRTWFGTVGRQASFDTEELEVVIELPSNTFVEWIGHKYGVRITEILEELCPGLSARFVSAERRSA